MIQSDRTAHHCRTIKVLFTGPDLERSVGGVQTHANLFIRAFRNHPQIRLEFFRTSLGLYKSESSIRKVARLAQLSYPFFKFACQSDVVHINSSFGSASLVRDFFYVAIARYIAKKPVVLQFHGGIPHEMPLFRIRIIRLALSRVLFRANRILILSKSQLESLRTFIPDIHAQLVPNFIETQPTKRSRQRTADVQFLFMARLTQDKGLKEIVTAADQLSKTHHNFRVVICGDGPDVRWLEDCLRDDHRSSYIVFLGRVSGIHKSDIFECSDVFLLPSRAEAFPYGVLEAFNHSMPVIATMVGAIPDVIEHGANGLLLEKPTTEAVFQSMLYFLDNIDEITRMGEVAKRVVDENYSMSKLLSTFTTIYSESSNKG